MTLRSVAFAALLALAACSDSSDAPDDAAAAPGPLPPPTDRAAWYARAPWTEGCEREYSEQARAGESGVRIHPLGGHRYLVEAQCHPGAYQARYEFVVYDASVAPPRATLVRFPEHDGERWIVEDGIAGQVAFDGARRELHVFSKSRGVGDCGQVVRYAFPGGAPKLVEVRARDCAPPAEGEKVPPPQTWPLVPLDRIPPLEAAADTSAEPVP